MLTNVLKEIVHSRDVYGEQGIEWYYGGWGFGDVKGLKQKVVELWGLVVGSVLVYGGEVLECVWSRG